MSKIRMRGFSEIISFKEALNILLNQVSIPVNSKEVPINESLGRVLAEDVTSEWDIPPFNRSAVDGYAVKSEDTFGASVENPVMLDVIEKIEAGSSPSKKISSKQTSEVMTGAPIPEGADAVVMVEYTKPLENNKIEVYRPVVKGENISLKGEDIKKGQKVLKKGLIIRSQDIGVLAALNRSQVRVYCKPKCTLICTGNELAEPGDQKKLPEGKIINCTAPIVINLLKEANCTPIYFGIVEDDLNKIQNAIMEAVSNTDFVIVTGGTSVGKKDFAIEAVESLGKIIFHGISMRPGKPFGVGVVKNKPVFLMSGFPVAAMVQFQFIVQPFIQRNLGVIPPYAPCKVKAKLIKRVPSNAGRTEFLRVHLVKEKDGYIAFPLRISGSGILTTISNANGIVVVPEGCEGLEKGDIVEVILLRNQIGEGST